MQNKDKIILDLCGGTGAWSKPYKDAGYDVRLITLPMFDVRTYVPPANVYGILAAPPCTQFSVARNHKLGRDYKTGMEVVDACMRIIEECNPTFWALENPVGKLKNFIGQPKFSFQPYEFGDPWTKRTCIWGRCKQPLKQFTWKYVKKIPELYIRPNRGKPSIAFLHVSAKKYITSFNPFVAKTDAEFRAITPQGFAKAFFEVNR